MVNKDSLEGAMSPSLCRSHSDKLRHLLTHSWGARGTLRNRPHMNLRVGGAGGEVTHVVPRRGASHCTSAKP